MSKWGRGRSDGGGVSVAEMIGHRSRIILVTVASSMIAICLPPGGGALKVTEALLWVLYTQIHLPGSMPVLNDGG